jgi:hypothetical protein
MDTEKRRRHLNIPGEQFKNGLRRTRDIFRRFLTVRLDMDGDGGHVNSNPQTLTMKSQWQQITTILSPPYILKAESCQYVSGIKQYQLQRT